MEFVSTFITAPTVMDSNENVDDSLKKKDYSRTLVLLAIPVVIALWFFIKELIDWSRKDSRECDERIAMITASKDRSIDSLNRVHNEYLSKLVDKWEKKANSVDNEVNEINELAERNTAGNIKINKALKKIKK